MLTTLSSKVVPLLTQDVMHLQAIFNLNQEDDDANAASGHKVTTAKETMHPKHPLWAKALEHIKRR
jgi:hypothetical protein